MNWEQRIVAWYKSYASEHPITGPLIPALSLVGGFAIFIAVLVIVPTVISCTNQTGGSISECLSNQ